MRPTITLTKNLPSSLQLILPPLLIHLPRKLPLQEPLQLNIEILLRGLQHHRLPTQRTLVLLVALHADHTPYTKHVVAAQPDRLVGDVVAHGTQVVVELRDEGEQGRADGEGGGAREVVRRDVRRGVCVEVAEVLGGREGLCRVQGGLFVEFLEDLGEGYAVEFLEFEEVEERGVDCEEAVEGDVGFFGSGLG